MREYKGLKYKTYMDVDEEKTFSKVYFCATKKDFENWFDCLSYDIWECKKTITFWYKDFSMKNIQKENDSKMFVDDLLQMQLFVIPVTYDFLYTINEARLVEFQIAFENHIPVLPILMEPGLDSEFNRICMNVQAIDRCRTDSMVESYKKKLKKSIKNILLEDTYLESVLNAFEGSIFFSYRKKDRELALQVMKKIQENDFCRDIAIWYDEFLIPGENFKQIIADEINKCLLVVVLVTENLLEENNFVMSVEYPLAVKMKKVILPIASSEIFQKYERGEIMELKELFENVPHPIDADNVEKMREELYECLGDKILEKRKSDAIHLFYIALAYLEGINVIVDSEKAIILLKASAQLNYYLAFEKLKDVYQYGIGVQIDLEQALFWQEKLIRLSLEVYESAKRVEIAEFILEKIEEYIEILEIIGNHKVLYETLKLYLNYAHEFRKKYENINLYCAELDGFAKIVKILFEEKAINKCVIYMKEYYKVFYKFFDFFDKEWRNKNENNIKELVKYIWQCKYEIKYCEEIYEGRELEIEKKIRDLRITNAMKKKEALIEVYNKMNIQIIQYSSVRMKLAMIADNIECAMNEMHNILTLCNQLEEIKYSFCVAKAYYLSGIMCVKMEKYVMAEEYYERALTISKKNPYENDNELLMLQIQIYKEMLILSELRDNYGEINRLVKIILEKSQSFYEISKSTESMILISEVYSKLGDIVQKTDGPDYALPFYENANDIIQEIYSRYHEPWAREYLWNTVYDLQDNAQKRGDIKQSEYYKKLNMEINIEKAVEDLLLESQTSIDCVMNKLYKIMRKYIELGYKFDIDKWWIDSYVLLENVKKPVEGLKYISEAAINVVEERSGDEVSYILMKLYFEYADLLKKCGDKRSTKVTTWRAIQLGRHLIKIKKSEKIEKIVKEKCGEFEQYLSEENLLTEEHLHRKTVIYMNKLSEVTEFMALLLKIIKRDFFEAIIYELNGQYKEAVGKCEFLCYILEKFNLSNVYFEDYEEFENDYGYFIEVLKNSIFEKKKTNAVEEFCEMNTFRTNKNKDNKMKKGIKGGRILYLIYLSLIRLYSSIGMVEKSVMCYDKISSVEKNIDLIGEKSLKISQLRMSLQNEIITDIQ